MPLLAFGENLSGGDIQRRKERQGAVAEIITGMTFGALWVERQHRLAAFQGLNLAFLVHAKQQGILGWADIKPHNIPHLLHKQRIRGQLKGLSAVGLQSESAPDAGNAFVGKAAPGGHGTSAPVSGILRFCVQGQADDFGHLFITDGAGSAAAGQVEYPAQPGFVKAFP